MPEATELRGSSKEPKAGKRPAGWGLPQAMSACESLPGIRSFRRQIANISQKKATPYP